MRREREEFREVAPGMLVSNEVKVSIPHPEQAFILRDESGENILALSDSLLVFSSQEAAAEYALRFELIGAVVNSHQWDDLVDNLGDRFADCIVDHSGESGFQSVVPLQKGI